MKNLETSLEFSHNEIADVKTEISNLKQLIGNIAIEDRRTQFQVKDVTDRMDKMDSQSKKKNLIYEGLPEAEDRKVICSIFYQISVNSLNRGINFDALTCKHSILGPFYLLVAKPCHRCIKVGSKHKNVIQANDTHMIHTEVRVNGNQVHKNRTRQPPDQYFSCLSVRLRNPTSLPSGPASPQ